MKGVKQRKRRWFGSGEALKPLSSSPPSATASSLPNLGGSTLSAAMTDGRRSPGKPPSVASAHSAPHTRSFRGGSFDTNGSSGAGSMRGRRDSRATSGPTDTDRESLTRSVREKEIEEAENTVDKWGTRPGGVAERTERAWGLGDDAHMGLS